MNEIRWDIAAAMWPYPAFSPAACRFASTFALIAALVLTGVCTAFPLMLRRPVTDLVRIPIWSRGDAATPAGTRIALIARAPMCCFQLERYFRYRFGSQL